MIWSILVAASFVVLVVSVLSVVKRVAAVTSDEILKAQEERDAAHRDAVDARDKLARVEEWNAILERKVDEYRACISGIITERDKWHHWYVENAFLAGNAQHMMMGELERLSPASTQMQILIKTLYSSIEKLPDAELVDAKVTRDLRRKMMMVAKQDPRAFEISDTIKAIREAISEQGDQVKAFGGPKTHVMPAPLPDQGAAAIGPGTRTETPTLPEGRVA